MNGAHRIQELNYLRGGAALVISLDTLQNPWLCKTFCGDRGKQCIKKWDEELQLWISSGHTTQADDELHPITCLYILDRGGSPTPPSWMNNHPKPSWVTQPPAPFSVPSHCHLVELSQPIHQPKITSIQSITGNFVSEGPNEGPWIRLTLNKWDFFSSITKNLNVAAKEDIVMMGHNVFSILCDDDCSMPLELFNDIYYKEGGWMNNGIISGHKHDTRNVTGALKNFTPSGTQSPNMNNSEGCQREKIAADRINTSKLKSLLKQSRSYDGPMVSSERAKDGLKRKSVSFVDDVTVYLFDQESPTMDLQSSPEKCTSPLPSCPYSVPDLTLDDSGLEWEDDFSALDWARTNCHQCVQQPGHRALSVSHLCSPVRTPQSWTVLSRSQRFILPQTCLFLTHVTESDLEL